MMLDTFVLSPAAQASYDVFMEHLRECQACPRDGMSRCADAEELVRVYLATIRAG